MSSTPTTQSRLGLGVDTSASPLPPPGSIESDLWQPDWVGSSTDVWNKGMSRTSISSDVSPLTPTRSNSVLSSSTLRKGSMTVIEEDAAEEDGVIEPTPQKEHTPRRAAISAASAAFISSASPINSCRKDVEEPVVKSKKRRGAKTDVKSSDTKLTGGKNDKQGDKIDEVGSNSTTPRMPQRKHQKPSPSRRQQPDANHNAQRGVYSPAKNVQPWPLQAEFSGMDARRQYLSNRGFGGQFPQAGTSLTQNSSPYLPSAVPAYPGFGNPAAAHHFPSSGDSLRGQTNPGVSGYAGFSLIDSFGPQGGYGSQAGNVDPSLSSFSSQGWPANHMMAPDVAYQQAGRFPMRQEQGERRSYGTSSSALVQIGSHPTRGQPGGLSLSSQTLAQFSNLPFADNTEYAPMTSEGVIKIGNIPYSSTKQDVWSALGKTAKVIVDCPIHIIMERSTAKTMDCFIEFLTVNDARAMIKKFDRMQEDGRPAKIGLRAVEYELGSQHVLMKSLFPRAKCVDWTGGSPKILECTDPYSTGFQGFVTREEMHQLVRHAEVPARAPYSSKCPQRPYECMISTLYKFPWHVKDRYTNEDRFLMFKSTFAMVKALCHQLKKTDRMDNLDEGLLRELMVAAMKTPGIAERERVILAKIVYHEGIHINLPQDMHEIYRLSPFANDWPFEVIGRKAEGVNDQICAFYFDLLARCASAKRARMESDGMQAHLPFHVNHDDSAEDARTMAKEIEVETAFLEELLTQYAPQVGFTGFSDPQTDDDRRFNDSMQEMKHQSDLLAAAIGTNKGPMVYAGPRSQGQGDSLGLAGSPFVSPVQRNPQLSGYRNPVSQSPDPGATQIGRYAAHPQPFTSPYQQPAMPFGQPGSGQAPFNQGVEQVDRFYERGVFPYQAPNFGR